MGHRQHLTRSVIAVVAVAVVSSLLLVADAASLGGLRSATLDALSEDAQQSLPQIISCDNFAKASRKGTQVDGRPVQLPASCGSATWAVNTGTWRITGGQARADGSHATATVPAGRNDVSVEATFKPGGATPTGGVTFAHTGGTNPSYLAAVVTSGAVQLRLRSAGTVTTIATAPATTGTTLRLRATLTSTNTVIISLNGVVVLTRTLTSGQNPGGTRAGLYDHAGSVRFDDFLVTNAWPP